MAYSTKHDYPNTMIEKLNNLELWALWRLANARQAHKRKMGVKTKKFDSATDLQIDYFGLKGEYVVARFLGLDLNMAITTGGDGGVDMTYNGTTIDVKTSTTRDLIFISDGHFKSEIAFLVIPSDRNALYAWLEPAPVDPHITKGKYRFRDMNIVGWATKATLIFLGDVVNYGYGPRKMIRGTKLRKPEEFKIMYEQEVFT